MPIVSPRAKMLFAWGVWAALLVADLAWIAVCGNEVPFWDDWEFVPQLTGGRPVTYAWLWSAHAEHRIALPRLLYLGAVRIAGGALRAPLIANVLLLAAAAAVLLLAIRRMRGRTVATDALVPIVFMHPGHAQVFLWGMGLAVSSWALPMLDPFHTPSDRGIQSTRLDITTPRGGEIVLRTTPGPANELSWDWSVWTAVDVSAGG